MPSLDVDGDLVQGDGLPSRTRLPTEDQPLAHQQPGNGLHDGQLVHAQRRRLGGHQLQGRVQVLAAAQPEELSIERAWSLLVFPGGSSWDLLLAALEDQAINLRLALADVDGPLPAARGCHPVLQRPRRQVLCQSLSLYRRQELEPRQRPILQSPIMPRLPTLRPLARIGLKLLEEALEDIGVAALNGTIAQPEEV